MVPVIQISSCSGKVRTGALVGFASPDQHIANAAAVTTSICCMFIAKPLTHERQADEHRGAAPGAPPVRSIRALSQGSRLHPILDGRVSVPASPLPIHLLEVCVNHTIILAWPLGFVLPR